MEATNEVSVGMTAMSETKRRVVPAVIVGVVLVALAVAFFVMRGPDGGGAAMAATTNATKDGKKDGKDEKKPPVPVSVEAARVGEISSYISATANLVAEQQVDLTAETEGRVTSLHVEEGDAVARGAVLATLNRDDAQILFNKARVRSANAKAAFDRASELHKRGLLAKSEFDAREMELRVANEELNEAEYRLSKTTIRAPFSGRVTAREIVAGQHVRPGAKLFTLVDTDPLIARIYLPERDVVGLREKQPVRMTLRADEGVSFAGKIRQISPVVDVATGTVKLTIEADRVPDAVRPGAFVTVNVTREKRPSAILIPRHAVIRELSDAHVFVLAKTAEGDVARRRVVTLGLEEDAHIEALTGLKAGEKVIVAGQGGLREGSPVKVLAATIKTETAPAPTR